MSIEVVLSIITAAAAILYGVSLFRTVNAAATSTERANEIADAIRSGADAFLRRQYRTVAMVGLPILLLFTAPPRFGFCVHATSP